MIEVKNVCKKFGKTTVVKKADVVFRPGEIAGIVGRNGSGKTVLFKIICGLLEPSAGEVIVNGERVGKDVDFPADVGVIIETPGFLEYCSGLQNLMELADINRKIGKERVWEVIQEVGLDPSSRKPVGKYSLGMRQRLGIAQAIMENPSVLILDEPMNGLDSYGVSEIRALLLRLKSEGKTIVIASHNREDIKQLCDVVYRMEDGVLQLE